MPVVVSVVLVVVVEVVFLCWFLARTANVGHFGFFTLGDELRSLFEVYLPPMSPPKPSLAGALAGWLTRPHSF